MGHGAMTTESEPLVLHLGPVLQNMSDHEFFEFCQLNPDWRIERTSAGDLIIMPPTGGWTGILCPDFVVELRSRSDDVGALQAKMQEYIANGAELGWLIDPYEKKVYVYRPHADVECLDNPTTMSGDPVLPGFTLDRQRLWSEASATYR